MVVRIRVPAALRDLVGGANSVDVDVEGRDGLVTVAEALDALAADHPELERRVRDERGQARVHVNVFVGADNVRDLDGLGTRILPGLEVTVVPAVSGG